MSIDNKTPNGLTLTFSVQVSKVLDRYRYSGAPAPKPDKTPITAGHHRCCHRVLFCKIQVRLWSCRSYPLWRPWHKVKLKFACPLSFSESNWSKYFRLYWLLWPWKGFLNLVRVWCQVWIQQRVLKEQRSSAHWTYFIKILSNYNTQSLYHFKNSVIVAQKLILSLFILSNH